MYDEQLRTELEIALTECEAGVTRIERILSWLEREEAEQSDIDFLRQRAEAINGMV